MMKDQRQGDAFATVIIHVDVEACARRKFKIWRARQ
jgi:hypothetical protein